MPETQSKFLKQIIKQAEPDEQRVFTSERQHTAQAFTLHVDYRDGRHSEGFAWAHYTGYRWSDNGDAERLLLIFGPRAVEIEGHNLAPLVAEIREGQLNSIRELPTGQQKLMLHANPDNQPIIAAVRSYPDIDDILKEIRGEDDDKGGHARRVQR